MKPAILYKYFPPERDSFLNELLIRFTPPDSFNDPFDSLPSFNGFDANFIRQKVENIGLDMAFQFALEDMPEVEKQIKISAITPANKLLQKQYLSDPTILATYFQRAHRNRLSKDIGILSLSKNPKSILMWSHYAVEHKGFVVGFNSGDEFFSHHAGEPEDIGMLLHVDYDNNRPSINVQRINGSEPIPDIFFTKNTEWDYEQEWRIIRFLKDAREIRSENVHLFQVPPTAIREIIIGSKTESQTVANLNSAFNQNPNLSHISFFKAALSHAKYEMDISQLSIQEIQSKL